MSAALDALRALLAGTPGAHRALLPACLAETFGVEAFGGVMIAELFARHARPLSPDPHVIETAAALAVFDADLQGREQAVIADLYDGRIGRLWRVGPSGEEPLDEASEPALDVPFEPFLTQRRPAAAFAPSDFPELDEAGTAALGRVAEPLALAVDPTTGCALPLRAFGRADGSGAALFACAVNDGGLVRAPRFRLAACAFRYGVDGRVLSERRLIDATPPRSRLRSLVTPAPGVET